MSHTEPQLHLVHFAKSFVTELNNFIVYMSQMPGTPYTKQVPSAPYSAGINVDLQSNASRRDKEDVASATADGKTRQVDWRQVISAIDRIMFVVSLTAIVVTISVLFPR